MSNQAEFAAELIQLEEELNYAKAFAASDPAVSGNLARANNELNAAFATYNKTSGGKSLSTGEANEVSTRLAIVRELLANPTSPVANSYGASAPAVIVNTQLAPSLGKGTKVFEIGMWALGIIPGAILASRKSKARNYFTALEQRINTNAAQIDVYLDRRAQILRSCPGFTADIDPLLASGLPREARNITSGRIDHAYQLLVEQDKARNGGNISAELASALRADRNVQREITAARTLYNDTVNMWNRDIYQWPAKQMVAVSERLTTRPVFVSSQLSSAIELSGVR